MRNDVVTYVVKAFLSARVEKKHILQIARTMKEEFGVETEEEAVQLVKDYLKSIDGGASQTPEV